MRLLLDECMHPAVALPVIDAGNDVVTVVGLGLSGATDVVVLARAREQDRTVVTLDTDFGELLARRGHASPSEILIRRADHRPVALAEVILDVIASSREALLQGALAVVGERTVRLR